MKKPWLVAGGALFGALIVATIIVVVAVKPKEASYDPKSPEGVVQAYLRAIRDGDFERAKGYIEPAALQRCDGLGPPERFAREQLEDTTVTLERARTDGGAATVTVRIQHEDGGPFASGSGYGYQIDFRLTQVSGAWLLGGLASDGLPWPLYQCPKPARPPV
jgi:hypothetical protein